MIALDTTVLVYAKGTEHPLGLAGLPRAGCQSPVSSHRQGGIVVVGLGERL
jgi:hypothetical protein